MELVDFGIEERIRDAVGKIEVDLGVRRALFARGEFRDLFFEKAEVERKAGFFGASGLLETQDFARAADFEVAHADFETGAQM